MHSGPQRFPVLHAIAERRRHPVIAENHQIVPASAGELRHPPDLRDPGIRPPQIGQRLFARRAKVMRQLVVLHERAVDDRHAEIYVEQDCHRLQLAHDDVAQDADERENAFRVRHPPRQLAARPLPFLQQPFERALQRHANHANWMEQDQQRHPRSAEPPIHRHLLSRGDGERHGLRVTVQQIHVARSAGESARRLDAVADVLHAVRGIAGDYAPSRLVVEAKCRNAVVLAVKHSGLAVGSRRRQSAEPSPQREPLAQEPRDRRTKSELQRPAQVRVRKRVDLQHDQSALRWPRSFFTRKSPVLRAVVPAQERTGARASPPLHYARRRSI